MLADKQKLRKVFFKKHTGSPALENVTKPQEVTALLQRWNQGDDHALDLLIHQVYGDMRRLASYLLRGERPGHTLQPTALANEAYLKLAVKRDFQWQNRGHFLAVATRAMRQVLIDNARRRMRGKRGGDLEFVPLQEELMFTAERSQELLNLDVALERLTTVNVRQSRIVELRIFGGLCNEEIGEVVGISANTVTREWNRAIAWLGNEMKVDADGRRTEKED